MENGCSEYIGSPSTRITQEWYGRWPKWHFLCGIMAQQTTLLQLKIGWIWKLDNGHGFSVPGNVNECRWTPCQRRNTWPFGMRQRICTYFLLSLPIHLMEGNGKFLHLPSPHLRKWSKKEDSTKAKELLLIVWLTERFEWCKAKKNPSGHWPRNVPFGGMGTDWPKASKANCQPPIPIFTMATAAARWLYSLYVNCQQNPTIGGPSDMNGNEWYTTGGPLLRFSGVS